MPGWHEETRDLVADGKLVLLGVTQEQHAERCQLYAKWQKFDWPILHDPINQLGCNAVPVTIAIDEQGVVRSTNPKPKWLRDTFLNTPASPQNKPNSRPAVRPQVAQLLAIAESANSATAWQNLGDAIMLWKPSRSTEAVNAYRKAIALSDAAPLHFRLGVAMRHRFETSERQPQDFTKAVEHWTIALRKDPNQYIWRRRIQQYGPRLDKPYPFYDWIEEALADMAGGDNELALHVPLSGAEVAQPSRNTSANAPTSTAQSPDPDNKITRDFGQLVRIEPTVVRSSNEKKQSEIRLHLDLRVTDQAAWNNEAEPVQVFFEPTPGVSTPNRLLLHDPQITSAESNEIRVLDAEFLGNPGVTTQIRGFVLYYVCEKSSHQCILRRQDFDVPIRIE